MADSTIRLRQLNQPEISGYTVQIVLDLLSHQNLNVAATGNLTGSFYPLDLNPKNYQTTGTFPTFIDLNSSIAQLASYVSQNYYPLSNPSGFGTGNSTGNYVTQSQLIQTSGILESSIESQISSFSGFVNLNYATAFNLNATGSYLDNEIKLTGAYLDSRINQITGQVSGFNYLLGMINSLSGYCNNTFATISNLNATGSYLNNSISLVSGDLKTNYVTNSSLSGALTGLSGSLSYINFTTGLNPGYDLYGIYFPQILPSVPKTVLVQLIGSSLEPSIIYSYKISSLTTAGFNLSLSDTLGSYSNLVVMAKL